MKSKDLLVVGNLAKDVIDSQEMFGGSAGSIAVNAKRLGISTGIMSVLGKDVFSFGYRDFLNKVGVETGLVADCLVELPVCEVVSRHNTIDSSIWHDHGCHPAMEKMEIKAEVLRDYKMVHLVSCPPGLSERLAQLGPTLSYEPGPMLVADSSYFSQAVADKSKFIFLNEEESAVVASSRQLKRPDEVLTSDGQVLVVTRGKSGSDLFVRGREGVDCQHVPANVVDEVAVTNHIGAGDGYKAGFLAAYLSGQYLLACAQLGSEVGALAVAQTGGIIEEQRLLPLRQTIRS